MSWNDGKCRALKWSASQVFHEIDLIAVTGANQVARHTRVTTQSRIYKQSKQT